MPAPGSRPLTPNLSRSLSLMLYELVAGTQPFAHVRDAVSASAVIAGHLNQPVPPRTLRSCGGPCSPDLAPPILRLLPTNR